MGFNSGFKGLKRKRGIKGKVDRERKYKAK